MESTFEAEAGPPPDVPDVMKGRIFSDEELIDYDAFRDAVRDYIKWDIRDGRDHLTSTLLSEAV
jgi:hypothetical protein